MKIFDDFINKLDPQKRFFSLNDIKELGRYKYKIDDQIKAHWVEKFDKRTNPQGREYYWLTGEFINNDNSKESDEWALNNGYISIVPITHDLTKYSVLKNLQNWDF